MLWMQGLDTDLNLGLQPDLDPGPSVDSGSELDPIIKNKNIRWGDLLGKIQIQIIWIQTFPLTQI